MKNNRIIYQPNPPIGSTTNFVVQHQDGVCLKHKEMEEELTDDEILYNFLSEFASKISDAKTIGRKIHLTHQCESYIEKNFISKAVLEDAITQEMLICHKENTPTSRLTSLLARLGFLKGGNVKDDYISKAELKEEVEKGMKKIDIRNEKDREERAKMGCYNKALQDIINKFNL